MNYTNPYERIQTYYTWLRFIDDTYEADDETTPTGISLERLHEITGIPLSVLRNDFHVILQWQKSVQNTLDQWDNYYHDDMFLEFDFLNADYTLHQQDHIRNSYDCFMDNQRTDFSELLLSGFLDRLFFFAAPSSDAALFTVVLSPDEAAAMQSLRTDYLHSSSQFSGSSAFSVKDSYLYQHTYSDLYQKLIQINLAIVQKKTLKFRYSTAHNGIKTFTVSPVKITYDATENLYSILGTYQNQFMTYRLDRILQFYPDASAAEELPRDLLRIMPNVWGNSFSDNPYHVKVAFLHVANVWNKVRKDLACRTNGQIYEENDRLIYEDTVYGIVKFRSWVYGFGRAAIVLEPQSLREEIMQSLTEKIKYYSETSQ